MQHAKKLRLIREKTGLNQTNFGDLIRIHQSDICKYETGKRLPTLYVAYKYIELAEMEGLGIFSVEDLIPREEVLGR